MMRKIEALLLDNGWTWNYAHGTAKKMFKVDRVEWLSDGNMHKLVAALQPGGYLHLATDWQDYADQMAEVLASIDTLVAEPPRPLPSPSLPCPRPSTRFERRGERLGHGITDLIRYKQA